MPALVLQVNYLSFALGHVEDFEVIAYHSSRAGLCHMSIRGGAEYLIFMLVLHALSCPVATFAPPCHRGKNC